MTDRRTFVKSAAVPVLGTMMPSAQSLPANPKRDFLKELGVKPVINAAGALTALTGSLMLPEAAAAWHSASRQFVRFDELHEAVGTHSCETSQKRMRGRALANPGRRQEENKVCGKGS
jgi:hypothetical protein